ncbi:MAG: hypothetical protein IKV52_01420, partial [Oscillospiraceae bacterium]|nr:hypothetical protein [Oscillospiraceae bacterium]
LAYTAILFIAQPKLYYWDEIRIWGASAKIVKEYDRLYSVGINLSSNDRNYPAGHTILNYFYSFFEQNYSEILQLAAYGMLFFAVFAAAGKLVEQKTGKKALSIGTYFALVMLPFVQNQHHIDFVGYSSISYAYGTTMVDFNLAVVFLAVLVLYFADMDNVWYVLPSVYLITVKKAGIFFALLAFCVIFCFAFFSDKFDIRKLKKVALVLVFALVIPLASYFAWNVHLDHYAPQEMDSPYKLTAADYKATLLAANIVSETDIIAKVKYMTADEGVVPQKTELSTFDRIMRRLQSDRFAEITEDMKTYFEENCELVNVRDKYLIIGLLVLGVVVAVFAERKYRVALVLTSVGLTAGCFVYALCMSYQMVSYNDQMVEYPRYMLSYYYGWIFVMLIITLVFVQRKTLIKKLIVYFIAAACVMYVYSIGPDRTIIDAPDDLYSEYQQLEQKLEPVNEIVGKDDRVLLVWMSGYDDILYNHKYYLMPAICNVDTQGTDIDFSVNFRNPDTYQGSEDYFNFATEEVFGQILLQYYDYLYVCNEFDTEFADGYKGLFDSEVTANTLYRVTDGEFILQKVV